MHEFSNPTVSQTDMCSNKVGGSSQAQLVVVVVRVPRGQCGRARSGGGARLSLGTFSHLEEHLLRFASESLHAQRICSLVGGGMTMFLPFDGAVKMLQNDISYLN